MLINPPPSPLLSFLSPEPSHICSQLPSMSNLDSALQSFKLERALDVDTQTKTAAFLGTVDNQAAIVILEKTDLKTEAVSERNFLSHIVEQSKVINSNDVYTWAKATLKQDLNDFPAAKLILIYPATETHIRKYDSQKLHYVRETPEMYRQFVVPHIEAMKGDRLKWVYNILFHGAESETVIYHDESQAGFVLLPDMKWDGVNLASLYLCCIVNRTDIASVRDLTGDHVKYLKNIQNKIKDVTFHRYGLKPDQLRIFVHYQPSYYHFHLHVVNIAHPGLGDGINVGKAILLDDIIDNLVADKEFYQKRSIGYVLGENSGLWKIEGYRNS
ncbi:uncharacterized protein LODBEIA_P57720 [Lodderomyces beijingensis]|uniref:Scavenger mRNA decapping enzyme n=1 Tax=Lodderomyces beijingensis TaxID=1775926 RepID=A0ABP0ZTS9_9ASCO